MSETNSVLPVDNEKVKKTKVSLFQRNEVEKMSKINRNMVIKLRVRDQEKYSTSSIKSRLFTSGSVRYKRTEFCGEKELVKIKNFDIKRCLENKNKLNQKERFEKKKRYLSILS